MKLPPHWYILERADGSAIYGTGRFELPKRAAAQRPLASFDLARSLYPLVWGATWSAPGDPHRHKLNVKLRTNGRDGQI
jgi:hypothetical protein